MCFFRFLRLCGGLRVALSAADRLLVVPPPGFRRRRLTGFSSMPFLPIARRVTRDAGTAPCGILRRISRFNPAAFSIHARSQTARRFHTVPRIQTASRQQRR